MDRLEAMTILIAAVDAGSFSAASRKLGVPLPTISRKISELEAHLKTRLLVRSTRKLRLTESGAEYLTASKRIIECVNDAEAHASGAHVAPKGDLILTAPIAFGRIHVIPIVNAFLRTYPAINVRLLLADQNVSLIEDHIDIAVRIGALPDSSMIATGVGHVRRVVCASPSYLAEHGTPKKPEDLAEMPCVTFAGAVPGMAWVFPAHGAARALSVRTKCRLHVNTAEAAIDAAADGIGVTRVLSYQIEKLVRTNVLRILLKDCEPPPLPVSLLHAGQGLLPLKTRCFLDFAIPRLRNALPAVARVVP
jgi:DNA-binding transcriptional LysR family regulator